MFTLSLPNYQSSPKQGIAPFTSLAGSTEAQTVWQWQQSSELQAIAIKDEDKVVVNDTVTFSIPDGAETITTVKIGDNKFLYSFTSQPGTFSINRETGQVVVYLASSPPANLEIIIFAVVINNAPKTTDICDSLPAILREINAVGNINFSRSLFSHPSASFGFYICGEDEENVRDRLCNGTRINLFNVPFIVNNLRLTRIKGSNYLEVQVALIGKHAGRNNPSVSPLDKLVRLTDLTGNTGQGTDKSASLKAISYLAGVSYAGKDVNWWLPVNLSSGATTTFRREFESRVRINGQFPFYSGAIPEARDWGQTTTHYLASSDVLSDEVVSINGHGAIIDGVKLSREYRNAVLKLDFSNIPLAGNQVICRYEFENTTSPFGATLAGEETAFGIYQPQYLANPRKNLLRDVSNNFDQGGFTKIVRKVFEVNGLKTRVEEKVYGYAFTSSDVYTYNLVTDPETQEEVIQLNFVNLNPSDYWGLRKRTVTIFEYDEDGYLIAEIVTGNVDARYKQESENLEAITLLAKAQQADTSQERVNFQTETTYFASDQKLPINTYTQYFLEKYSSYYSDIVPPHVTGTWVEPKFSGRKVTFGEEYLIKEKPSYDEARINKPLVTGQRFRSETRQIVTRVSDPERFVSQVYAKQEEGSYFKKAAKIRTSSDLGGRPAVQTRLNRLFYSSAFLEAISVHNQYKNTKFFLSTGEPGDLEEETISFPGVYNLEQAIAAARTKLSIENTRNAETLTLDTLWHPEYHEGDRLWYKNRLYVILSINANISIDRGRLSCDRLSLTLGRYLNPEVNLVSRNIKGIAKSRFL